MRPNLITYLVFVVAIGLAGSAWAQKADVASFDLEENGEIPAWIIAGPFEQGIVGFGTARDDDVIGETEAAPTDGQSESSNLVLGGSVSWRPVSASNGYLDFMEATGWSLPSDEPEKVWKAKVAYAFAYVDSESDRQVVLRIGSNSGLKVVLNGETVHSFVGDRDAIPDADSVALNLLAGSNSLLIKVGQTHRNETPAFFAALAWQWGFYARLTDASGSPERDISISVPASTQPSDAEFVSTFFFKEVGASLVQRFDLFVDSRSRVPQPGHVDIKSAGETVSRAIGDIPFGRSRHEIWLPAVETLHTGTVTLSIGAEVSTLDVNLEPRPRYEIHLAQMSHQDIGYTSIQPVVKERTLRWLDDVVIRCESDSSFKWTIETIWQLEQYQKGRPQQDFDRLLTCVHSGQIAVSPVYTNPYTGWVSNEEFIRAFDKGRKLADEYDIPRDAAVYNDVPGLSWLVPQVMADQGITFLATGINEVYGGYPLQRNLPKAFRWEGPGGGSIVTYRNEAYNEGQTYGLEKDTSAVPFKLWERLHRLNAQGYTADMVLAIHTFGDNGPIPLNALPTALAWNSAYAWPRFEISTIHDFGAAFSDKYGGDLPVLRGDWTSTWDVLYQGEPDRMIRQRWVQNNLPTAEKMATIAWLQSPSQEPLTDIVEGAYENLLHFSGHGSGLEYGYASPSDNLTAMAYREQYVQDAFLQTTAVFERSLSKLTLTEESFEGEALYIFNPLNWTRDAPIEVEFPRENGHRYRPVDIDTGEEVPFDYSGYTLRFVVRDLPSVGFRKVRLHRIESEQTSSIDSDLEINDCSIENTFYRITIDCDGSLIEVVDKRSGRLISGGTFAAPMKADSLYSLDFAALDSGDQQVTIIDQRPARLVAVFTRVNHVFERTEISLWEGYDAVHVEHSLDLTELDETDQVEDYSAGFEFELINPDKRVDQAGGFLDPETDRMPGIDHDAYSVRRGISMSEPDYTIDWIAIDSRVSRLRSSLDGRPRVFANLANNFPENWNRWEPNDAKLRYRFAVQARAGGVDTPRSARFGWESSVPPAVRYTWLRSSPGAGSFLKVDGNVVLTSMRRTQDEIELRLLNTDMIDSSVATISSERFTISPSTQEVVLKPGQIKTYNFLIK
jgi:hypothetical protein